MTYVVTEACINCKYKQCVQVCPVDAFREGDNATAIDPQICINCGLCVSECPVNAIYPDYAVPDVMKDFITLNADLAKKWPVASPDLGPLPDAENWVNVKDKLTYLKA